MARRLASAGVSSEGARASKGPSIEALRATGARAVTEARVATPTRSARPAARGAGRAQANRVILGRVIEARPVGALSTRGASPGAGRVVSLRTTGRATTVGPCARRRAKGLGEGEALAPASVLGAASPRPGPLFRFIIEASIIRCGARGLGLATAFFEGAGFMVVALPAAAAVFISHAATSATISTATISKAVATISTAMISKVAAVVFTGTLAASRRPARPGSRVAQVGAAAPAAPKPPPPRPARLGARATPAPTREGIAAPAAATPRPAQRTAAAPIESTGPETAGAAACIGATAGPASAHGAPRRAATRRTPIPGGDATLSVFVGPFSRSGREAASAASGKSSEAATLGPATSRASTTAARRGGRGREAGGATLRSTTTVVASAARPLGPETCRAKTRRGPTATSAPGPTTGVGATGPSAAQGRDGRTVAAAAAITSPRAARLGGVALGRARDLHLAAVKTSVGVTSIHRGLHPQSERVLESRERRATRQAPGRTGTTRRVGVARPRSALEASRGRPAAATPAASSRGASSTGPARSPTPTMGAETGPGGASASSRASAGRSTVFGACTIARSTRPAFRSRRAPRGAPPRRARGRGVTRGVARVTVGVGAPGERGRGFTRAARRRDAAASI